MKIKKYPFVSIIILSYNGLAYLENCLNSIKEQNYPSDRYEVIVADNGSTDNSVSFLKSKYDKDIVLLTFDVNHGFAKGNNIAADVAKGELLAFLNQDTIVDRCWLSELVNGVEDGGFDACHSNMLLPRNNEFKNVSNRAFPKKTYYYEINKYGYVDQVIRDYSENIIPTKFLSGASFILRKSVLEKIAYLFDERFGSYNEDMDLGFRLLKNGYSIGLVPSSVVYHLSSFSLKFNNYNIWKNLMIIRNRMIVFWKSLSLKEFFRFVPYLLISQSHKVFTRCTALNYATSKSVALTCSVFPLSLIAFAWFLYHVPKGRRWNYRGTEDDTVLS